MTLFFINLKCLWKYNTVQIISVKITKYKMLNLRWTQLVGKDSFLGMFILNTPLIKCVHGVGGNQPALRLQSESENTLESKTNKADDDLWSSWRDQNSHGKRSRAHVKMTSTWFCLFSEGAHRLFSHFPSEKKKIMCKKEICAWEFSQDSPPLFFFKNAQDF